MELRTNATGKGHLGRGWANWCSNVMTTMLGFLFFFFFFFFVVFFVVFVFESLMERSMLHLVRSKGLTAPVSGWVVLSHSHCIITCQQVKKRFLYR